MKKYRSDQTEKKNDDKPKKVVDLLSSVWYSSINGETEMIRYYEFTPTGKWFVRGSDGKFLSFYQDSFEDLLSLLE